MNRSTLSTFTDIEKDDLLRELGFEGRIDYEEPIDYGDKRKDRVDDFKHRDIVSRRFGLDAMHKIAKDVHRSPNTVMRHIHNHNDDVKKRGYCVRCQRIRHPVAEKHVGPTGL